MTLSPELTKRLAHIKATTGNQYMLSSGAASAAVGPPRGPNPYACPDMGSMDRYANFTRAQAERFFSTVIYGYIREAIVAGVTGQQTASALFTPMVTHQGQLWANFDTSPLPMPVNDWFMTTGASAPPRMTSPVGAPVKAGPTALSGLGEAPKLVTVNGKKLFATSQGYVIPGNTNGHVVDPFNWLWWAYVTGAATAGKAWGSSPQIKAWGAPFKGYSTLLDKVAPGVIEAVVILGVTYGFASAGAAGAAGGGGGGSGAAADSGSASLEPTTVGTAAPTNPPLTTITQTTGFTASDLAPVAAPAGAGGGGSLLTSVASDISKGSTLLKAGVGVATATGIIKAPAKTGGPVNTKLPLATAAAPASGIGDLLKKSLPLVAVALGLKLLLLG